jgi:signal transduction histidine kinase
MISVKKYKKEIWFVTAFYVIMAFLYYAALVFDIGRLINFRTVLFNYILKGILTIPFVWLYFSKLRNLELWKKALLHLLTVLLFSFVWIKSYYFICDSLGLIRMKGGRAVWDFYLAALFYFFQFGIFHIYAYSKRLRQQEILSAELSKMNAQSELSALKAQLNPHFLYNVFNTINAAIPSSAKNARNMVHELSDLFRYQLNASREDFVPLKEEIDFVRKYLDLEKERFGKRLDYQINIPKYLEEEMVPPILLQPLVENAIKHGISPMIGGGRITIDIESENGMMNFTICDTGKGIGNLSRDQLMQKGVGLSHTNKRLESMYNQSIDIKENEDGGLCVLFSIPFSSKAQEV